MFYEKLNITVDIERLRQAVKDFVFTLGDPLIQGSEYGYENFGGWSLQSRTGDWRDGWQIDPTTMLEQNGIITSAMVPQIQRVLDIAHSFEHVNPTQAQQGYIAEVMNEIDELGFMPRHARVSMLRPGGRTIMHRDADPSVYLARIHIPLWTAEQCIHSCDGIDLHMPADGSVYMMWVNRDHQVYNGSTENRYHIIMDAYDTNGVTEQFNYSRDTMNLQDEAVSFRKKMDAVEISVQELDYFNKLKEKFLK